MSADEQYPSAEADETLAEAGIDEALPPAETEEGDGGAPASPNLAQPPASTLPLSPTHLDRDPTQDEDPTYTVEPWNGLTRYVCLLDGHEGWTLETFEQHMDVYHRGIMREAPPGPGRGSDAATQAALEAAHAGAGHAPETTEADEAAPADAPADEGV
jgi:hypothetical protein